jgi:hypothetical protein
MAFDLEYAYRIPAADELLRRLNAVKAAPRFKEIVIPLLMPNAGLALAPEWIIERYVRAFIAYRRAVLGASVHFEIIRIVPHREVLEALLLDEDFAVAQELAKYLEEAHERLLRNQLHRIPVCRSAGRGVSYVRVASKPAKTPKTIDENAIFC